MNKHQGLMKEKLHQHQKLFESQFLNLTKLSKLFNLSQICFIYKMQIIFHVYFNKLSNENIIHSFNSHLMSADSEHLLF